VGRKNKDVVFFGVVALIGILLSKQVDDPFPGLYPWLFKNVPGFNAFREASKFYFLIALGYSVLIGSFVDWLWKWAQQKKPIIKLPKSIKSPSTTNQTTVQSVVLPK